jgi:hypothetical protein
MRVVYVNILKNSNLKGPEHRILPQNLLVTVRSTVRSDEEIPRSGRDEREETTANPKPAPTKVYQKEE